MKNITFTLLFISILSIKSLSAQISDYQHPPSILGQEQLSINVDSSLTLSPLHLIIHDMDEADFSTYTLSISEGENYSINENTITPDANFIGNLHVQISVNDGEFESEKYEMLISVKNPNVVYQHALLGQKPAQTYLNEPYTITMDKLYMKSLPTHINAKFYVAPDGNDSNAGTFDSPLKTLNGARAKVRLYKNLHGMPADGITIFFREGDYYLTSTVNFDSGDSGSKDKFISYRAYPNERVRFTGAKKILQEWIEDAPEAITTKISSTSARSKIKMVNLKSRGITSYGNIGHVGYGVSNQPISPCNIYVDGKAMHLSRWPNTENIDDIQSHVGKNVFTSTSKRVTTWENTGDLWIDGALSKPWEWKKNKIKTIESSGTVTMVYDYHNDIVNDNCKMFYFNMIEELDYPEEYFLDREKGILYFYPPNNLQPESEIRISQSASKLLSLSGTKYVRFIDLRFEGTRNSAIELNNSASYNEFLNCEINSVGLDGLKIKGTANVVRNSHIHDIGANGIYLDGGNSSNLSPARNLVENCKINDFSQERKVYNPGLTLFGIGQVVRNMELYNGPHMAIKIKGNNHIIEYSDIHRAPHEYSDMLAVYFNTGSYPLMRGTIIRRNKFHDVNGTWKQSAGVYMDNETSGVLVEENYFYNNVAQENGWSVMVHGGADNIVRKNVFVYASYPFAISLRLNGYASGDFEGRLIKWSSEFKSKANSDYFKYYPELNHFFDDEGVTPNPNNYTYDIKKDAEGNITNYWDRRTPNTNVFSDNLVYNESSSIFKMKDMSREFYTVSNFRTIDGIMQENLISDNNHNVNVDPGFVDYSNRDLAFNPATIDANLKSVLPHLKNMPFNKMGLKTKVGVLFNDFPFSTDSVELIMVDTVAVNYSIIDHVVTPDEGFKGELSIPVKVKVGSSWESDVFMFKIEVKDPKDDLPKFISLSPSSAAIYMGDTVKYSVTVGAGLDSSMVEVYSRDESIASVDAMGNIIGRNPGKVQIVAALPDMSYADSSKIIVFYKDLPDPIENTATDLISIYPNPANDILFVDGVHSEATFTIVSMSGAVMIKDNNPQIDIKALRPGLYILEVQKEDLRIRQKFVKQ